MDISTAYYHGWSLSHSWHSDLQLQNVLKLGVRKHGCKSQKWIFPGKFLEMKRGVRDERSVNNDTLDPRLGGVVKAACSDVTLAFLYLYRWVTWEGWAASLGEHGIRSPRYKR